MFRPLSLKTVRWRPLQGEGLEHLTVRTVDGGVRAEGVAIGERDAASYGVSYRIDCDSGWRVRSLLLKDTTGRQLALASDGDGHWRSPDGTPRPEFDGCIDIDLSGSPFTNTLPIRRLNLDPSQGTARLRMLYIPFDTLEPVVDGQLYTCLVPARRYLYEAEDGAFRAELPVDEDGLVTDYPTLCQRL
ncbi:putative glycolipid-binding domain-containing protein [Rhizobium sp. TRM95111]|uniref:putative glycolipid-binding domain-containing protein n=1 Tax=Rhizobium alarense TaxID=2846851 RepID=UPI001F2D198E|nr:putative glycolipid-binding domain-containing protein [Rhizobium alarense]MCF3638396.1 putative glycolipid-binding domain-containing protein [Rhizobium alarense]